MDTSEERVCAKRSISDFWDRFVNDKSLTVTERKIICKGFALGSHEALRRDCATYLRENITIADIDALVQLSYSPSWYVRSEVACTLDDLRPTNKAMAVLVRLLNDPDAIVRRDAGTALALYPKAIPDLIERLKKERNHLVKSGILFSLAVLCGEPYRARLVDMLLSDNHHARSSTLLFIEELSDLRQQETDADLITAIEALMLVEEIGYVKTRALEVLEVLKR